MVRWGWLAWLGVASAACNSSSDFSCDGDDQCLSQGVPGRCEMGGQCSFPNPDCESGFSYGNGAGNLTGTCVPPRAETTTESTSSSGPGTSTTNGSAGTDTTTPCSAPQIDCSGICVDPSSDPMNCGDCGIPCDAVEGATVACAESQCVFTCDPDRLPTLDGNGCTACGAPLVLADGPIAYWRLGEAPGSTAAVDLTGTQADGAIIDVELGVPGISPSDTAARFGVDTTSVIEFPSFPMPTGNISVELWVAHLQANNPSFISYAVTGRDNELLIWEEMGQVGVWLADSEVLFAPSINDGQWHHIAVSWSVTAGVATLYVDGVEADSVTRAGSIEAGGSLVFGQEQDLVGPPYAAAQRHVGELDEVAIFATALTAAQVAAHHAAGPCPR